MKPVQTVVEMRGITKRFPGIIANDNINLVVKKGEIHALLGENGAGKSTLMNVLFGLYQPEEGEILINEKPVKITSPSVANDLGIGMVHQHFMLVEKFTVTENIVLGNEPKSGLQIDMQSAIKAVEKLSNQYGLKVDPRAKIEDISVGMQQRVEILKTLYRGADILIFDEPTAVLTPQEIVELIEIMHNLVKEGKTIILITHKLKEIMAVCDTVTIIRRGKVIDSVGVKDTNPDDLAAKMVGREVNFRVDKKEANPKEVILSVENITAMGNRGVNALNSISLEVRSGEILGIAGVDGNGQSELIEVLTGLRKASSGRVLLKGQDITNKTPRVISESGLSHIPEDRHKHGLVLDFPMSENMVLETYFHPEFNKNGFLDYAAIDKHASKLIEEFDVRTPSIHTPARALSGGNQQKAIIAREVNKDPDLLIAAQPTRGLDVGAIEFIHRRLIEQRDKGKAVLLLSLELDEIINVSDRIAVIYEGQIVGIVDAKQTDEQELGLMMSGGKRMQGGGNGE
ncbi:MULTISPECIES: ABC transporter ATP-binding protein [Brevibacillus]|uniref:ABC transporter ATP-binding protein n=2 Tax=Brevibacillus TaxID=55080 RepID=M8DKJ9_9BACL|nr:ABC transporter ATP-binding protein [Brevibacillus borstelensis]EMT54118.1 ABC transporter ATP-binding protein [Brevibacillus borstelensis AK1]MED1746434.1 ABC transporter ATP-binding protein [Brevibacillus borstelensis]MED1872354.1 ABC transporter ATP-binding protein [Brevibacillus borstelensis]MED1881040.1 ABC transporter ATP-binding protein [Brevibacillus borstelensis]MED2006902.1 ABC transporter ATP-binding protein [Brevibacillus borstelensis]